MPKIYKGSLKLDKVEGIRHDLGRRATIVPLKKDTSLPQPTKIFKNKQNITKDGKRF